MVKIIIGLVMLIGGLSGNLVLLGTNSGAALAALGGVFIVWGMVRMVRQKQNRSNIKT
jgi:drug/metabolite transporter superfamily protein YnfA